MSRLLLARHGLTDWNFHNRFQGQSDIPLNEMGSRQVFALAQRLAPEPVKTIYSSDLRRSLETARTIAVQICAVQQAQGLESAPKIIQVPEMREISFGDWEGLTYAEIEQRDPEHLAAWQTDIMNVAPPNGETLAKLIERIEPFQARLASADERETCLVVGHGGPLQTLICLLMGLSPHMYWQFHLSTASLSEIRTYPQGAILNLTNDTCHLHALGH